MSARRPTPAEKGCNINTCESEHAAAGYCRTHYYRMKKYGSPYGVRSESKLRLPIQPLLAWFETRGGVSTVLLATGNLERAERAIRRGKERGWMTDAVADDFAVNILRTHPCTIWGDEWWQAIERGRKDVA